MDCSYYYLRWAEVHFILQSATRRQQESCNSADRLVLKLHHRQKRDTKDPDAQTGPDVFIQINI